jgi:hypothetical protein
MIQGSNAGSEFTPIHISQNIIVGLLRLGTDAAILFLQNSGPVSFWHEPDRDSSNLFHGR